MTKIFKRIIFLSLIFILCSISVYSLDIAFYENFVMSPHNKYFAFIGNVTPVTWSSSYRDWYFNSTSTVRHLFNDSTVNNTGFLMHYLPPLSIGVINVWTSDFIDINMSSGYFSFDSRVPNTNGAVGIELKLYDTNNNVVIFKSFSPETQNWRHTVIQFNSTYANKKLHKIWFNLKTMVTPDNAYHFLSNVTIGNISSGFVSILNLTSYSIDATCWNKSVANSDVNISLYFAEGYNNTIRYALNDFSTLRANFYKDEEFTLGDCSVDKSYFKSPYIISNNSYSYDNKCLLYALGNSMLCLQSVKETYYDTITESYKDDCTGKLSSYNSPKEYYFTADKVFNINTTYGTRFKIYQPKTIYTHTFYDSLNRQIINVTLNQTSLGNLTVKINDSIIYNHYHNVNDNIGLLSLFDYENQKITFSVAWQDGDIVASTVSVYYINFTDLYMIGNKNYFENTGWSPISPIITTYDYYFEGFYSIPDPSTWSTLTLNNGYGNVITSTSWGGIRYFNLYVSDDYNLLNGNYDKYILNKNILKCDALQPLPKGFTDVTDSIQDIEYDMCYNIGIIIFGITTKNIDICGLVIWLLAIIILLVTVSLLVAVNSYTHISLNQSVSLGLMFWSIGMIMFSFVVSYYTAWKITIGVMFTFSLISFILGVFFGESSTGGVQ